MASKLRGQVQKYRVVNGLVLSQSSSSIHTLVVEATLHRPINKTFIIRKGLGFRVLPKEPQSFPTAYGYTALELQSPTSKKRYERQGYVFKFISPA